MDWKTIPGLARDLNVSDATVRRYISNFPQFFQAKKIEGWDHYSVESLEILRRINKISAAGQRRSEVLKKLLKDFKVISDLPSDPVSVKSGVFEFGPRSIALIESISNALQNIATSLETIKKESDNVGE